MEEIQEYIPITKAKNMLLETIRRIEIDDETVAITKNGVPVAVMLSMEKFNGLLETLDVLSDEAAISSLRKSIREGPGDNWVSYEEVFGE